MIATIINYCTNDYRFLSHCVREANTFSNQIIVPVCDHFFNGEPEDDCLYGLTYQEVEPFCDVFAPPRVKKVNRQSLLCDLLLKS